jgi:hypothetical protein
MDEEDYLKKILILESKLKKIKDCGSKAAKKNYQKNRVERLKKQKKYNDENKERIRLYKKQYRAKNKEKLAEKRKIWYRKNKIKKAEAKKIDTAEPEETSESDN